MRRQELPLMQGEDRLEVFRASSQGHFFVWVRLSVNNLILNVRLLHSVNRSLKVNGTARSRESGLCGGESIEIVLPDTGEMWAVIGFPTRRSNRTRAYSIQQ